MTTYTHWCPTCSWCYHTPEECPVTPPVPSPYRSLAVEIVDYIHGYTYEFSGQPGVHQQEYDVVEEIISRALVLAALHQAEMET